MTEWLANPTLAHLRDVVEWPDLGERYEVRGRLGRGGMGVVYAAHDRRLDREVAVKVLDAVDSDAAAASRLRQEAQILARLEHPGIVPVHDSDTLGDGRVFYVMKLVRGAPLDRAIGADRPLVDRLDIFARICETVSFAHAQGIVHRDLKPSNIMVGRFGEVLVLDWGVAGLAGRVPAHEKVVGTPGFMPPEQSQTQSSAIDPRSDVYALGVLLQGLLRTPAPRPLAAIAAKARADRAEDRFATVAELADDVARFRRGEPVQAYRESVLERAARLYRRYRVPILLVLAYMIMRVILLLWLRV
jgi:serine/threonine protein kinase